MNPRCGTPETELIGLVDEVNCPSVETGTTDGSSLKECVDAEDL